VDWKNVFLPIHPKEEFSDAASPLHGSGCSALFAWPPASSPTGSIVAASASTRCARPSSSISSPTARRYDDDSAVPSANTNQEVGIKVQSHSPPAARSVDADRRPAPPGHPADPAAGQPGPFALSAGIGSSFLTSPPRGLTWHVKTAAVKKPERFRGEIDIIFDDTIPVELKVREAGDPLAEVAVDTRYPGTGQAAAYAAVNRLGIVVVLDLPTGNTVSRTWRTACPWSSGPLLMKGPYPPVSSSLSSTAIIPGRVP
jgi:hypothetical protein